jgi:hypothetical protein
MRGIPSMMDDMDELDAYTAAATPLKALARPARRDRLSQHVGPEAVRGAGAIGWRGSYLNSGNDIHRGWPSLHADSGSVKAARKARAEAPVMATLSADGRCFCGSRGLRLFPWCLSRLLPTRLLLRAMAQLWHGGTGAVGNGGRNSWLQLIGPSWTRHVRLV